MSINPKRTEIKPEFLGAAADNSFVSNISTPRSVMHFSHVSSRPSLINPDKKLLLTGIEGELGKYINDVRTDEDITVKAVISKRSDLGLSNPETILIVEFERDGEVWLDMIEVPNHRSSHGFFGYSLHPTEELQNVTYNTSLPEGTVLAKTDSYADDGTYKFGTSVNVALMSHPSVTEDGFVVSESFLNKNKFTSVTKRVIYLTKDNLPINLYGNEEEFRMFPEIGEPVRADGLLCGTRERNDWFSIADLNNDSVSEIDYTFDNPVYVPVNSIVVDVNIVRGNYNRTEYAPEMTAQLDRHAANLIAYYKDIVRRYDKVVWELKKLYGDGFEPRQTPRLRRYVADCIIKSEAPTSRDKLCYRRINIDEYRVEITCMSVVRPNLGYKFSDMHAAKGVICRVLPDEDMPVDELGNRADVIADAGSSTISRMNIGRSYEHYIGAASRDNQQRLIDKYSKVKGVNYINNLSQEDINYGIDYLRGFYSLFNSEMVEFISLLNEEEREVHLKECLTDEIYIYLPTDNEKNIIEIIKGLEKSAYAPHLGKVTYRDELGILTTTVDDVRIGKMYMMALDKVANDYSAVSSSKVNSFNFPIKGGPSDRNRYPHSLTPTTTLSETEVRIMASFADPSLLAELMDLALNPISHKLLVKNILESDEAFNTDYDIDRDVDDYGNTKSIMLLRHIFVAAGFDIEYVDNDA